MTDSDLADEIIQRLNNLIKDPHVRHDIGKLIELRIDASPRTCTHPTIQVQLNQLGLLGVLNGIVGAIDSGPRLHRGHIAVKLDDSNNLVSFVKVTTQPLDCGLCAEGS